MKEVVRQIVLWLGIMAILTMLALGLWMLLFDGAQTTTSLKWLQLFQLLSMLALPPILGAWIWTADHQPFRWLRLDVGMTWQVALLAILVMVCAIPGINLLADLNGKVVLPKSLDFIELFLRQQEDAAAALTQRFLQADNFGGLLLNIGLMALLPALAEELTFRGTMMQILHHTPSKANAHMAVWIAAIIFSAVHMQFYGFIPRMLLGAMFGYAFLWTGCLWVPILMHFTNNAIAVLSYYLFDEIGQNGQSLADMVGTGRMWWIGAISIVLTLGLVWLLRTHASKQK